MHGNVGEWCSDWYAPYPAVVCTDPTGPAAVPGDRIDVAKRTARGGSWYDEQHKLRSAKRWGFMPAASSHYLGFRIVLDAGDLPR